MLDYIYGYKKDEPRRKAFSRLAKNIFGLDFEKWHAFGGWNDNYICHTLFDGDSAAANVSVNKMSLFLNGEKRKALQIGTVMTRPDMRRKGLARELMDRVHRKYSEDERLFYLLGHEEVQGFYTKLGYRPATQKIFTSLLKQEAFCSGKGRFLNLSEKSDMKLLLKISARRLPVSSRFGFEKAEHILLFYGCHGFDDFFYYLKDREAIVVFNQENQLLTLYDIICPARLTVPEILESVPLKGAAKILYHFTPDLGSIACETHPHTEDNIFFVKEGSAFPQMDFFYPLAAQA